MPWGINPLPEPVLTQICVAIYGYSLLEHNELSIYIPEI